MSVLERRFSARSRDSADAALTACRVLMAADPDAQRRPKAVGSHTPTPAQWWTFEEPPRFLIVTSALLAIGIRNQPDRAGRGLLADSPAQYPGRRPLRNLSAVQTVLGAVGLRLDLAPGERWIFESDEFESDEEVDQSLLSVRAARKADVA